MDAVVAVLDSRPEGGGGGVGEGFGVVGVEYAHDGPGPEPGVVDVDGLATVAIDFGDGARERLAGEGGFALAPRELARDGFGGDRFDVGTAFARSKSGLVVCADALGWCAGACDFNGAFGDEDVGAGVIDSDGEGGADG